MVAFTITTRVEATPERVFDVFSDITRAADRISGIEKIEMLTDGAVGKGTRFRETRVFMKREATEEMEFTEFDRGKSYNIGCHSSGCEYDMEFRFLAEGSGTEVEARFNSRPITFLAKLMSPLGLLMIGTMKKCMAKDFEELKAVVEGAAGSGVTESE